MNLDSVASLIKDGYDERKLDDICFDINCVSIENSVSCNSNYLSHGEMLVDKIEQSLTLSEREMEEKWNLDKYTFNFEDSENPKAILTKLYDNIGERFDNANSMEILKDREMLNENKNYIIDAFYDEIENLKNQHAFSNKEINQMKIDAKNIVDKNFDKTIERVIKNDAGEKILDLCDEWKDAYRSGNLYLMDHIYDELYRHYTAKYIYRGETIEKEAQKTLLMHKYLENKMERTDEEKITDLELEVFDKLFK